MEILILALVMLVAMATVDIPSQPRTVRVRRRDR